MNKTILAAVVSVLLGLPVANAQPWGKGMAEKLNLTDQQIEQLQNLKIQAEKQIIPKKADLKLAKLELKELLMKPKVDEKAALAKADKISSIKAEIARMKLQDMLAMRKVLTDEQLKTRMKMPHEMGPRKGRVKGCENMGCMMHGPMMGPGHEMGPGMQHGMGMEQTPPEKK